jgi:hypothetical protein
MNKKKMKTKKIGYDETLKVLNKILLKHFDKEFITVDKKDNMLFTPIGVFMKEKNKWYFNIDFSFITINNNFVMIMYIIKSIVEKGIKLEFFRGHYSIYHPVSEKCIDVIYDDDVDELRERLGISESGAIDIIKGGIIDKYNEEIMVD